MIKRYFICRSFITIQSETAARISRKSSIISHNKKSLFNLEFAFSAFCIGLHRSSKIFLFKDIALLSIILCFTNIHSIVFDLNSLSRQSNNPLNIWNSFFRRDKDDDITSLKITKPRSDFVHDNKIVFLKGRRHTCSYYRIWVCNKKSDKQHYSSHEYQKRYHIKKIEKKIFEFSLKSHNHQTLIV